MRVIKKHALSAVAAACLLTTATFLLPPPTALSSRATQQGAALRAREDAYRANNLGVALLEQFKPKEAAEEFRRALKLDPALALARTNLSIALYNARDGTAARAEAGAPGRPPPDPPQPHYVLGMIAKQQGRVEDALESFRRV